MTHTEFKVNKPDAEIICDGKYHPWVLVSNGQEIDRFGTYMQLIRSSVAKKFNIVEKTVPNPTGLALFELHWQPENKEDRPERGRFSAHRGSGRKLTTV